MRYRIWSEFLSCREAAEARVLDLLSTHGIVLQIRVEAESIGADLACLIRRAAERGVEIAPWLLLPRSAGYWPSERNAERFAAAVDDLIAWSRSEGLALRELCVDLEPPLSLHEAARGSRGLRALARTLRGWRSNLDRERFERATRVFGALQARLAAVGIASYVPVLPLVVDDAVGGREVFQDLCEAPVFAVNWDRISPMLYTTMLCQFSGGLLARRDALWLVYCYTRDLVQRVGAQASCSLGLTGIGVLGNERCYRTIGELREDAAAAKAAGTRDLALYNLEGLLRRPDAADWLRAVVEAEPRVPARSLRADALRGLLRGASPLLEGLR